MARSNLENRLGVAVKWRLFGTGPAIVNAFEKGELDLAYVGLPPAIIGICKGVDIVCIAGGHVEGTVICGKKRFAGFPEQEDLKTILNQLRGNKIGVPGKGSIHDVIITEYIGRYKLRDDIEIVNFQWADEITEAMAGEALPACIGTPALAVAVRRYADARMLYPPSRLWPNNPSYGILVNKHFLSKEKEMVQKFLVLHEEATSHIRKNPREAATIISRYVGVIDEDFVMETFKVSPKYCAQLTDGYISSTMEFVRTLRRQGYIDHEISARDIFDTSLIRKVHPAEDHYREGIEA